MSVAATNRGRASGMRLTAGMLRAALDGLPDSAPVEFEAEGVELIGFELRPSGVDLLVRVDARPDKSI